MKSLRNCCRIIFGVLFIFSGFVKGVDPLGSAYKFQEYFNAFGLSWFTFSSLFLSFLLSLLEFLIGIAMLFNLKIRGAAWGGFLFMIFFTFLSLFLALTNPVSDCGCFGDAIKLTNWETFFKNLLLLLIAWIIFSGRENFNSSLNSYREIGYLLFSGICMLALSLYCYIHLPILDFRPYAIGKNISEEMTIPEGKYPDQYSVILKYRNLTTGRTEEFNENNYPWNDTLNYSFESTTEVLIKKGYTPPIQNFIIEAPDYGDISEELLKDERITILIVSRKLIFSKKEVDDFNKLALYAQDMGYKIYGITSSSQEQVRRFKIYNDLQLDFLYSDDTQLKTMIRSNPGVIILQKGTVLGKWGQKDIPTPDQLRGKDLAAYCISNLNNNLDTVKTIALLLSLFFSFTMFHEVRRVSKRGRR